MPEKYKTYQNVIFSPEVIKKVEDALVNMLPKDKRELTLEELKISLLSGELWTHDNENEFFSDYRKGFETATFEKYYSGEKGILWLSVKGKDTEVSIRMPNRSEVESLFEIFEVNVQKCRLPTPTLKVFIGHGRNIQWRDLKDHLHEKHGLKVEAYEIGARAGLTIKEVLNDMLTSSSFALLVLTAEDEDVAERLHARENVIHELGLFQGRLGWRKTIALLEEGVEEFSNIHGINQIRFKRDNIQETFGEVLATIRREFPEKE